MSHLLKKIVDILKIKTDVFSYRLFQMLRAFVIVVIGLTIFRADTLTKAFNYLKSIFVIGKHQNITQMNLGLTVPDILILIVACIILFVVSFMQEKDINIREKIKNLRDYEYSLLKSILKKDYNISNCTIKYNKNGKPYLDDINNIYFSMSHSDKYLVIVISNKEIGVDIEEVKKYNTKINDILNIKVFLFLIL